jgi:RNA polymerase sigma-B factor
VEVHQIEEAMAAKGCFKVLSLDRPSDVNANLTLADLVAAEDDRTVDQLEAVDMLQPMLEELGARERRILELRFVEGWTQTEIGREVGLSQMQVSRVLRKVLDDLRTKLTPTRAVA